MRGHSRSLHCIADDVLDQHLVVAVQDVLVLTGHVAPYRVVTGRFCREVSVRYARRVLLHIPQQCAAAQHETHPAYVRAAPVLVALDGIVTEVDAATKHAMGGHPLIQSVQRLGASASGLPWK